MTMVRVEETGQQHKSEGFCCDFNQESVHPPNRPPWNHSRSNICVELNVIWIVRSQTDMAVRTRVVERQLYCCVHLRLRSVNKTMTIAMLSPSFEDQNLRGFRFYFSYNRRR